MIRTITVYMFGPALIYAILDDRQILPSFSDKLIRRAKQQQQQSV
jgi:hypothetical protein